MANTAAFHLNLSPTTFSWLHPRVTAPLAMNSSKYCGSRSKRASQRSAAKRSKTWARWRMVPTSTFCQYFTSCHYCAGRRYIRSANVPFLVQRPRANTKKDTARKSSRSNTSSSLMKLTGPWWRCVYTTEAIDVSAAWLTAVKTGDWFVPNGFTWLQCWCCLRRGHPLRETMICS